MKFIMNLMLLFLLNGCMAYSSPKLETLSTELKSEKIPSEMMLAWKSLRIAILADDVEAVAKVVHFPLRSLDYSLNELESFSELKKQFAKVFEPQLVKIIRNGEFSLAKGDPGYEVDCAEGYMIFGFEEYEGKYWLSYFGSINE